MPSTIRVRAVARADIVEVQSLIRHPMDSGLAKDKQGNLIPGHYIDVVTFQHSGRTVFTAYWGPAVSRDPYLQFRFKGGKKDDPLTVRWTDNKGESDSLDAKIL